MASSMTIYIAGPMTGIPDFNYPAFREAETLLKDAGHTCLNPADSELENVSGAPMPWTWYMRRALAMVITSDGIALLPGWENSPGANLEVTVARALQLPVMALNAWLANAAKMAR
jgi:nucleoside 2-deoxyribosyltransferase